MILLTGFEPFGGSFLNPSWGAAARAADLLRDEGSHVEAIELPVLFGGASVALREAIRRTEPDLVICAGLAGGRHGLSLERVAINCDDADIPDNAGIQPVDQAVVPGGPPAYFATLPIKAALQSLVAAGIPASVSQSAGTYVCNHVFYSLMHELAERPGVRGGFIHLPYERSQRPGGLIPSMELEKMAEGIAIVARTAFLDEPEIDQPEMGAGTRTRSAVGA